VIVPSRGQDVIDAFMGNHHAEVWKSDCWTAAVECPADLHQLCIPHQIRNLQGLIDERPRLRWRTRCKTCSAQPFMCGTIGTN